MSKLKQIISAVQITPTKGPNKCNQNILSYCFLCHIVT